MTWSADCTTCSANCRGKARLPISLIGLCGLSGGIGAMVPRWFRNVAALYCGHLFRGRTNSVQSPIQLRHTVGIPDCIALDCSRTRQLRRMRSRR